MTGKNENIEPITVSIEFILIERLLISIKNTIEDSREMLENHLVKFGETTNKNKCLARMYRQQISEQESLIEQLQMFEV